MATANKDERDKAKYDNSHGCSCGAMYKQILVTRSWNLSARESEYLQVECNTNHNHVTRTDQIGDFLDVHIHMQWIYYLIWYTLLDQPLTRSSEYHWSFLEEVTLMFYGLSQWRFQEFLTCASHLALNNKTIKFGTCPWVPYALKNKNVIIKKGQNIAT